MAFQTPITISKALEAIEHGKYVLPAIQREFRLAAQADRTSLRQPHAGVPSGPRTKRPSRTSRPCARSSRG